MVRNCELYEVVKENTFNSCYDKLLCRKCAVIVLRCNFTKHKKREQHIINHLDKDNYEDKIENIKDAYKRNKKPKKKIFLDGQYFDNLEKKQEYFKNKYKKKLQDKDDDLIFLSNLDEETQINIYNIIKHLELLPFDEDMGRDYTYLTKLLNGGNMDKHILKDILVSYNTYL